MYAPICIPQLSIKTSKDFYVHSFCVVHRNWHCRRHLYDFKKSFSYNHLEMEKFHSTWIYLYLPQTNNLGLVSNIERVFFSNFVIYTNAIYKRISYYFLLYTASTVPDKHSKYSIFYILSDIYGLLFFFVFYYLDQCDI